MRPVALALCALSTLFLLALFSASAPAAEAGARLSAGERTLVRAVNGVRARHGLPRLKRSPRLNRAADHHTRQMIAHDFFSHSSRNGASMSRRVRAFARSRRVGETIAMTSRCGRRGARRVVRMWMASSGHRAIVLSRSFRRIGVGARRGSLGAQRACVVTADFASRR
jgi:uncharacterized protein YkwD